MKWRLSGFSQVVQIRAPVSAAEPRFPPAGTSQQSSTSIIPLMDLIRAEAASPGLGAAEMGEREGSAEMEPVPWRGDGWTRSPLPQPRLQALLPQIKPELGIASPGSPAQNPPAVEGGGAPEPGM